MRINYAVFEHFIWLMLSVALFVFIVPIPVGSIFKSLIGLVFYLAIRRIWNWRVKSEEEDMIDKKMARLGQRVKQFSAKQKGVIYGHWLEGREEKEVDEGPQNR